MRHVYLSSPTRNFNRADGTRAKDGTYSLIDYLDPKATDAFLSIVHETYRKAVGDQFGKIVLGFFGDEPDWSSGIPWTPTLLEQFKEQKGYDLAPYIPQWFSHKPTEQSQRAMADYYDVWSGIFRSSFFGEQAAWAKKYNVEYLVHLNHEETMLALEHSEGDYFRDERYVQVPGIDNLDQLVPDAVHKPDGVWNINNNFPKLASSAAHLFGKPKVWAEEGGGVGVDGKYQLDFQAVRGVNALQLRVPILQRGPTGEAVTGPPPAVPPEAAMIAWYANRAGYLMAIGRPAAQVGLYHPGNSIWMGGKDAEEADRSTTKLGWELFEHQVDWDYFDEQSLSEVATLEDGGFKNLSGQVYKAIVFPSMTVITRTGLERLRAFAKSGGKVIFVGKTPRLILDRTFMDAKDVPDLSFATLIEPSGEITPQVLAALPSPDVKLDAEFPRLTYTHRAWSDGDMYYFFNESDKPESRVATIAGHGKAQAWDLGSGEIHPLADATYEGDAVRIPLTFGPYEAKVIVVGPLAQGRCRAGAGSCFAQHSPGVGRRLGAGPERQAVDHISEIVGGVGRKFLYRAGNVPQAVHGGQGACRQARVSGDCRRKRLCARHAQRKRAGGPVLAALSLGRDRSTEGGRKRSGDRGGYHARASKSIHGATAASCGSGRTPGTGCRFGCTGCADGRNRSRQCTAYGIGLAGPSQAGGALRHSLASFCETGCLQIEQTSPFAPKWHSGQAP